MAFFRDVHEDIQTVLKKKKDPAARNSIEVLLCYPGVWALIFHKPAHSLYKHKVKLLARIISQFARWLTGVEIIQVRPSAAGVLSTTEWRWSSARRPKSATM